MVQVSISTRLSRDVRAAEPIHVTRATLAITASGFLVEAIGRTILWRVPEGNRLAFALCSLGFVLISAGLLNHFDHHRTRFGLPALITVHLALLVWVVAFLPFVLNPSLYSTSEWGKTYLFAAWGVWQLLGSLGVFLVLMRKQARLEHGDKTAETEIHASFSQLVILSGGLLLWGVGNIGLSIDPTSHYSGLLTVFGPGLIAVAIIAHVEHLSLRIGRPAVTLTIIAALAWTVSNVPAVSDGIASDPAGRLFIWWGARAIAFIFGIIACVLVLAHKRAWQSNQT